MSIREAQLLFFLYSFWIIFCKSTDIVAERGKRLFVTKNEHPN